MILDLTKYRAYMVPILTRKAKEFDNNDKFLKYLTNFCGSPGAPPAAAVYMIADEIVGPNAELQKRAGRLISFYGYDEIII